MDEHHSLLTSPLKCLDNLNIEHRTWKIASISISHRQSTMISNVKKNLVISLSSYSLHNKQPIRIDCAKYKITKENEKWNKTPNEAICQLTFDQFVVTISHFHFFERNWMSGVLQYTMTWYKEWAQMNWIYVCKKEKKNITQNERNKFHSKIKINKWNPKCEFIVFS